MTDTDKILRKCESKLTMAHATIDPTEFDNGAKWAEEELTPIITALLADRERLREAIKHECCCPGEASWVSKKSIRCDSCQALIASDAAISELLKGCE